MDFRRNNDLTLISVTYKDKHFFDLNLDLTLFLNRKSRVDWLLVDNAFELNEYDDDAHHRRLRIMAGVPFETKSHGASGSYHHAKGLHKALDHAETRFILILDPDCYIVRKEWIQETLLHMDRHGLAFFGAPCHPKKPSSYRGFPYVACLFVDTDKVDASELDFTPHIDELRWLRGFRLATLLRWWVFRKMRAWAPSAMAMDHGYVGEVLLRKIIHQYVTNRFHIGDAWIGSSGDTGARIYRRFRKSRHHRFGCLTPVWKIEDHPHDRGTQNAVLDWILPDFLRVIPKRKSLFTHRSFSDFGLLDVEKTFDCESYLWNNEPYCFHIRQIGDRNFLMLKKTIETLKATHDRSLS